MNETNRQIKAANAWIEHRLGFIDDAELARRLAALGMTVEDAAIVFLSEPNPTDKRKERAPEELRRRK